MAGVDGLLRMMVSNGADELQLGTDDAPRMLRHGAALRLSIPATDDATLRHLLDGIFTAERETALRAEGKLDFSYTPDGGEPYAVTVAARGAGLQVGFKRGVARVAPVPVSPAPAPVPVARPLAPPEAPRPVVARAVEGVSAESVALLSRAVSMRASDLHLRSGEPATLRIDGKLRALDDVPAASVERLLDDCGAGQTAGASLDRALQVDGVGRFRVHVYRAGDRPAAAIRVLPRAVPRLEELHFPVALNELVQVPHGLVLVCGPAGSGKSATLAALAAETLRQRGGLLVSLEDPIEYALADEAGGGLVRQRQIGRDVRDFTTGLRDALREDPDIILIGEMRDTESISLALTAAETGHLVLASLHSRSAAATVERIVDSYAAERQQQIRVQLADALRAVIAQRLLPRAKGGGRVVALEILRGNHTVANLIREGKTAQIVSAIQAGRKEGMLPLERCLADLVRTGQVTREATLAAANDLSSLASYLQT